MKARLETKLATFELEAGTQKEMFKLMAETLEVFGESVCGLCYKGDLTFGVRNVKGDDYYEVVCRSCGAKLSYGQAKQKAGMLFPIRKLTAEGKPSRKDGEYGKHRGWTKYRGEVKTEETE